MPPHPTPPQDIRLILDRRELSFRNTWSRALPSLSKCMNKFGPRWLPPKFAVPYAQANDMSGTCGRADHTCSTSSSPSSRRGTPTRCNWSSAVCHGVACHDLHLSPSAFALPLPTCVCHPCRPKSSAASRRCRGRIVVAETHPPTDVAEEPEGCAHLRRAAASLSPPAEGELGNEPSFATIDELQALRHF